MWPLCILLPPFYMERTVVLPYFRTVNIDNLDFVSDTWCLHSTPTTGELATAKTVSRIKGVFLGNVRERMSQFPGYTVARKQSH